MTTITASFLFTDIEGSTRLWEMEPEPMRFALARHDLLVREAIEQNGGVVFKTIGDAFCAVFTDPHDGVRAMAAAQKALSQESWLTSRPLRVRMALHTGVAECRDDDYFGPPLNRAARLLSVGHGGQSLLSLATYELVRDQLDTQVGLTDLGAHRLKDLTRPEHVFQLAVPGLTERFPALKSLDSFPNNLPQQLTSFLGREEELHAVIALLTSSRLVTLTGSGGCGKTRLALQVGADLLERFPDGVFVVELAALTEPTQVVQAVAGALGISGLTGDPVHALGQVLHDRHLLLIVDNSEHLIDAVAQLANALLRACPELMILATSREALQVSGETLFRVPSLALPERHPPPPADKLSQFTAVQLFIERAQAVRADFTVTNANAPTVAEVCWRLDGIPLAIELAAARLRNMAIEDLFTRLEKNFAILTGGGRDKLPRQQTLRALIDWSYNLLHENEQVLLSRLSVFTGGWTLEAAEGICSTPGYPLGASQARETEIEEWEVLDLLSSLVDKSLVLLDGNRYKMLETIKQYTQEKAKDQTETLKERHLQWFKQKVETQFQKYNYENQPTAYAVLIPDLENLRAAIQFAWSREDPLTVLTLAGLPKWVWAYTGAAPEARQQLQRVWESVGSTPDSVTKGFALSAEANYAMSMGELENACELMESALALHRRLDHATGITDALCGLGVFSVYLSRFDKGAACYEEAIAINRTLGQASWEYTCIGNIGELYLFLGDFATAEDYIRKSLEEPNLEQNLQNYGERLENLARLYSMTNRLEEALVTYQRVVFVSHQIEQSHIVRISLSGLARVVLRQGQVARSVRLHGSVQPLCRRYFMSPFPFEKLAAAEDLAKARQALSPEIFERAWAAGFAMSVEEAVAYALEQTP